MNSENNNNNDNNNNINNNAPMEMIEFLLVSMGSMEHIVNPDEDDPFVLTENTYKRACDFMMWLNANKNIIKKERVKIPRGVPAEIRNVLNNHWKNNNIISYHKSNKASKNKRQVCKICGSLGVFGLREHQTRKVCKNAYAKKKAILWVKEHDIAGWDKAGENHPYIQKFQFINSALWDKMGRDKRRQRYRDALDDEWAVYERNQNGTFNKSFIVIKTDGTKRGGQTAERKVFKEWDAEHKEKWRLNLFKNTINAYYKNKARKEKITDINRRKFKRDYKLTINRFVNRVKIEEERKKRKRDYQIIKRTIKAYLKSKHKRVWYEYADKDTPSYANSRTLKVKGKGEKFYLTAYN